MAFSVIQYHFLSSVGFGVSTGYFLLKE